MPKTTILWAESPEPGQEAITYEFNTQAELDAFLKGIEEMDGWMGYRHVTEGYIVPKEGYSDDSEVGEDEDEDVG